MSLSVKILKASFGDAYILHCEHNGKNGIIVIDGGPKITSLQVTRELSMLGHIDLMVLTHFDHDHIAGLQRFVDSHITAEHFPVDEIWCNCAHYIKGISTSTRVSYSEAYNFAEGLSKVEGLIWKEDIVEGRVCDYGFCRIYVISPTVDDLRLNKNVYEEVIRNKKAVLPVKISQSRRIVDQNVPLKQLAANKTPSVSNSEDLINKTSIAMIVVCGDKSILMLGDARTENIVSHLKTKGYSPENPLKVDCVKVSHHGSRNNISIDLLDMINCEKYIISTDGGYGNSYHPDRETIAKLLCHPNRNCDVKRHIYFNYPLSTIMERVGEFIHKDEPSMYNIEIHDNVNSLEL